MTKKLILAAALAAAFASSGAISAPAPLSTSGGAASATSAANAQAISAARAKLSADMARLAANNAKRVAVSADVSRLNALRNPLVSSLAAAQNEALRRAEPISGINQALALMKADLTKERATVARLEAALNSSAPSPSSLELARLTVVADTLVSQLRTFESHVPQDAAYLARTEQELQRFIQDRTRANAEVLAKDAGWLNVVLSEASTAQAAVNAAAARLAQVQAQPLSPGLTGANPAVVQAQDVLSRALAALEKAKQQVALAKDNLARDTAQLSGPVVASNDPMVRNLLVEVQRARDNTAITAKGLANVRAELADVQSRMASVRTYIQGERERTASARAASQAKVNSILRSVDLATADLAKAQVALSQVQSVVAQVTAQLAPLTAQRNAGDAAIQFLLAEKAGIQRDIDQDQARLRALGA